MLTQVQPAINPDPQVSFHWVALQPLAPRFVCITRIIPCQVQNLALGLVKFHTVGDCPTWICAAAQALIFMKSAKIFSSERPLISVELTSGLAALLGDEGAGNHKGINSLGTRQNAASPTSSRETGFYTPMSCAPPPWGTEKTRSGNIPTPNHNRSYGK